MFSDITFQNVAIPVAMLILGWFLAVLQDRFSQRKLFDHRIRLEKEYGLYCDLWEKMFELRRSAGQAIDCIHDSGVVRHDEDFLELFNAYQAVVRRNEPFIHESILMPAREVTKNARQIIGNLGRQKTLIKRDIKGADHEALTPEYECLDDEINVTFERIEKLFSEIAEAIRRRVTP